MGGGHAVIRHSQVEIGGGSDRYQCHPQEDMHTYTHMYNVCIFIHYIYIYINTHVYIYICMYIHNYIYTHNLHYMII